MKKYYVLFILSAIIILSLGFTRHTRTASGDLDIPQIHNAQDTVWIAPESANELKNPTEVNEETLMDGKMIYNKNCRSCHGKLGDGTGSGGAELATKPSNFINIDFLKQTDGSMFWKISEGRKDMKSYKEKLDEEEIWLVVNYIKTFASNDQ